MRAVNGAGWGYRPLAGESRAIGSSPTCAGQYGVLVAGEHARHPGGGFNPPEPTTKGGPDYGRFIEAVRMLQDHARAVDAPDAVISEAADLVEKVSDLLSPFDTDEWATPSGRRIDLPNRGNILPVPMQVRRTDDGRIQGWARFRRFHLGRNGAVHGGALGLLFDSVLGMTSGVITGGPRQRTAYLHINYRQIVPIDKELQIDGGVDQVEGRKIFVSGRLSDGDTVLTDAEALFVLLKPGQP
jgi:acyl-coenzyme A thioesterase PaaI-like protein